jgi:hypothetical protein
VSREGHARRALCRFASVADSRRGLCGAGAMATQIQGVLDALRASTCTKLHECDAEAARHR